MINEKFQTINKIIMKQTAAVENIFHYDLTDEENRIFSINGKDEELYLQSASSQKILSDLHLLFLLRGDKENSSRIRSMISSF